MMVNSIARQGERVKVVELVARDGSDLPTFTAGAHIDLHLSAELVRSYSLINDPNERHRYVIAVALDRNSRGGSRFVHERLNESASLTISTPRNNFRLDEAGAHSVLIAGGIGITPYLSMISRLQMIGASWQLCFASRSRREAAFLDVLNAYRQARVLFDDERDGIYLDFEQLLKDAPPGSHFYCCGPRGMMDAFATAAKALPAARVHMEYFTSEAAPTDGEGFVVELAQSRKIVQVRSDQTILQALQEAGLNPAHGCTQGICGACETRVISGIPNHFDEVLSDEERASNRTMMICCSRSKSEKLVLDL
jgi:vanillate O-demethylase ferredoxin subunit